MAKMNETQAAGNIHRSVAGTRAAGTGGKAISPPVQRKVIPHETFTNSQETDVYKDDENKKVKLKEVWAKFKGDPIYNTVHADKLNVYVTSTNKKETAAYVRNMYDTDNFKVFVGDMVELTAPDKKVDAVVNFDLTKDAGGLNVADHNHLYRAGEKEDADLGDEFDFRGPEVSKLPFYYIITHEFGHIIQHLAAMEKSGWLKELVRADPTDPGREKLSLKYVDEWLRIARQLLEIVASGKAAEILIDMPEKFSWMLLSDIIDGFLMSVAGLDKDGPVDRTKLRQSTMRINWYLNIPIEYENMLKHEILPSMKEASGLNNKKFPIRTEHGRERQLEKELAKGEKKEEGKKDEGIKEDTVPAIIRESKEPIRDAAEAMHARLNAVSKDMVPVIKEHISQMELVYKMISPK